MINLTEAKRKYRYHKNRCGWCKSADGSPIEMRLTFEEWLKIWLDSGHWGDRGMHKGGYVMARHNDLGHYEIGNVAIKSNAENTREGRVGKKHTADVKKRISLAKKGQPLSQSHRAAIRKAQERPCTIDGGKTIYPSRKAFIAAGGSVKHPDFRYVTYEGQTMHLARPRTYSRTDARHHTLGKR